METKELIRKYEIEIKKIRMSGGDMRHHLYMIEAGKRILKIPPIYDDIEEQRKELYERTDKILLRALNMIEFYDGKTSTY